LIIVGWRAKVGAIITLARSAGGQNMKFTAFTTARALLAAAAVAAVAACGGGDPPTGSLRVSITDAPSCKIGNDDLEKVFVTVTQVRVHQSADAEPNNVGWINIPVSPAKKINLLDLTNGRLEELGRAPLGAGNYTQVRLVLSANSGSPPANSVVLLGDTVEIPLQTPSAAQTGLKIIRPFTVQEGTLVDLVIDFDACRSIVARGNGSYGLKPVLTADLKTVAGIVGVVDPTVAGVMVSAQKNGMVVRSTIPTTTGEFTLAYLDPANSPYDVVITAPARGTSVVAGVPADTSAVSRLSTAAQPIPLPAAGSPATRTASGILGPVAARDTGVVRALQAVGSVPKVEIATVNVNVADGTYSLTLPTAVPLFATFSTTLPLGFSAPASPSGTYTLEATATGYVAQTTAIGTGTANATWSPTLVAAP
jgi:hypothetical protein